VAVEQVPAPCCGKPYYKISKKDYTAVIASPGMLQKPLIENMRNSGASEKAIAKAFPETEFLGRSKATRTKYIVKDDKKKVSFETRVKWMCCAGGCMQPVNNCFDGILKGHLCAQVRTPIWNQEGVKVAHVVQLVPLYPVTPCCADFGPTLQMSIHREEGGPELDQDDLARLSLFMFTVKPNLGPNGGPMPFILKVLGSMALTKMGWALNFGLSNVETKFVTLRDVMNGEIAGIGDLVNRMRGIKKGE